MTLRESLGGDVQRIYEQVEALLDSEDGVVALFDGGRLVSYGSGFGVSASQLEFLGVELERTLRRSLGRQAANRNRRHRERHQTARHDDRVDGSGREAVGRLLRLASKVS
jgi:hypothetical protein